MSSVSSKMALAGQTVYSATKGAINSFTQVMAKEYGRKGIRVNAICPGFIYTEMVEQLPEDKKKRRNGQDLRARLRERRFDDRRRTSDVSRRDWHHIQDFFSECDTRRENLIYFSRLADRWQPCVCGDIDL